MAQAPKQVFIAAGEEEAEDNHEPDHEIIIRRPWEDTLNNLAHNPGAEFKVPRSPDLKRNVVINAFLDAFQLIGGTPRLSLWADENPTEYYKLLAKLAPKELLQQTKHEGDMTIRHILPKTNLDE